LQGWTNSEKTLRSEIGDGVVEEAGHPSLSKTRLATAARRSSGSVIALDPSIRRPVFGDDWGQKLAARGDVTKETMSQLGPVEAAALCRPLGGQHVILSISVKGGTWASSGTFW
jgi:hypothetical protein